MKRLLLLSLIASACSHGANDPVACEMLGVSCVPLPTAVAERSSCSTIAEYCDRSGVTTPSLACVGAPATPSTSTSTITLTGYVTEFSNGPDTAERTSPDAGTIDSSGVIVYDGPVVQIFAAKALSAGADPIGLTPMLSTTVGLDANERACDADPAKGCSVPSTACGATCNDGLDGRPDDTKYCRDDGNGATTCAPRLRWEARYTIAGVPVDQPLAIRVSGTNGQPSTHWSTMVTVGVTLSSAARACTSSSDVACIDASSQVYRMNVLAMSQLDYARIPQLAGIQGGILPGYGGILGEVHDCGDVRVDNVQVAATQVLASTSVAVSAGARLTYFSGAEGLSEPDARRASDGTDALGLFGVFAIPPGLVSISTRGIPFAGATAVSFGTATPYVYADTITFVTIN